MPKTVRTARGVVIDFDAVIIKQQIAEAPMNIEVARRKEFIDSKEGKARTRKPAVDVQPAPAVIKQDLPVKPAKATDFEIEGADAPVPKGPVEAVPVMPERK